MAKKKGALGKLLAFTTAVAAIGGVCYVFKDKIAESPLFKSASGKVGDICSSVKNKFSGDDEDDFLFDDWDFPEETDDESEEHVTREYTSITPSKESEDEKETENDTNNSKEETIPTINLNSDSDKEETDTTVSQYENEGLSDTYEDPDVLEDQDKLDF